MTNPAREPSAWLVLAALCTAGAPAVARAQAPSPGGITIRFASARTVFQPRERIEIAVRTPAGLDLDLREGPRGWMGVEVVLDREEGVATPLGRGLILETSPID